LQRPLPKLGVLELLTLIPQQLPSDHHILDKVLTNLLPGQSSQVLDVCLCPIRIPEQALAKIFETDGTILIKKMSHEHSVPHYTELSSPQSESGGVEVGVVYHSLGEAQRTNLLLAFRPPDEDIIVILQPNSNTEDFTFKEAQRGGLYVNYLP
jgi:hypothetical protein